MNLLAFCHFWVNFVLSQKKVKQNLNSWYASHSRVVASDILTDFTSLTTNQVWGLQKTLQGCIWWIVTFEKWRLMSDLTSSCSIPLQGHHQLIGRNYLQLYHSMQRNSQYSPGKWYWNRHLVMRDGEMMRSDCEACQILFSHCLLWRWPV